MTVEEGLGEQCEHNAVVLIVSLTTNLSCFQIAAMTHPGVKCAQYVRFRPIILDIVNESISL